MSSYDQFFKKLFETFFADLLRLVAPELAGKLFPERVRFCDKESGWPAGKRREVDLLAEVERVAGKPPLLVHVEIEARARRTMGPRLWQYYRLLRLGKRNPQVVPILVNLKGGWAGITKQTCIEEVEGDEIARFRYRCFGVSGCLAEEYLGKAEPLAWGLAALMRSQTWNRVEQKLECLRRIFTAPGLNEIQTHLLVDCVETYLELTRDEAAAFEELRTTPLGKEVATMQLTWSERNRRQGLKDAILLQLSERFGPVPEKVRRRIEAIQARSPLERIARDLLTAPSLEAVRID